MVRDPRFVCRIFDAHAHLASDVDPPTPRADAPSGFAVAGRLLCGVEQSDWNAVAEAAAAWPGTIPAFGLHPWFVADATGGWFDALERRLADCPAAWLGEAGLDAHKAGIAGAAPQETACRAQLRLAKRLSRRVNLHCVKAWDELLTLLDAEYLSGGASPGFIAHSFSGSDGHLRKLAERGAYFTIGPLFSYRESRRDRARAARIPEDRLLLESDFLLAVGGDATGELAHALEWLAAARGTDPRELGMRIADNAKRLFG